MSPDAHAERRRRAGWLATTLAIAVLAPGCGVHDLELRADTSIRVVRPSPESTVRVPFEVRWRSTDRAAARYAVFVDRAPVHPGQALRSLADHLCRQTRGCPDAAYYESKDVYVVDGTALRVTSLPVGEDGRRSRVHRITVVPLDGHQHRIGESASTVELLVARA